MTAPGEHDDDVDAALVGLIALEDPLARLVDEGWIRGAPWREAARALLAHRRRGGELGDLLTTATVLVEKTTLYAPNTMAADAILMALEARPVCRFMEHARRRAIRLRLQRAARALDTIAVADVDVIPRHIERVRDDLDRIALEAETGHADNGADRRAIPVEVA
jgi:hypothetical protein